MIALLIGGPHDGMFFTVDSTTPWLTDDGELRLPIDTDDTDPSEFAIYMEVKTEGQEPTETRNRKAAWRFSRLWTRPEEVSVE